MHAHNLLIFSNLFANPRNSLANGISGFFYFQPPAAAQIPSYPHVEFCNAGKARGLRPLALLFCGFVA
jgi:hypothetical protein